MTGHGLTLGAQVGQIRFFFHSENDLHQPRDVERRVMLKHTRAIVKEIKALVGILGKLPISFVKYF